MRPYEVLCTDDDPQWLTYRTEMVTGSEMVKVLGKAPKWMSGSVEDLLLEKRSGKPNPFPATRNMLWGSRCERRNMEDFCELTGVRARHVNVLLRSRRYERIGSTLDGLCRIPETPRTTLKDFISDEGHFDALMEGMWRRQGQFGALEMKQTGDWGLKNWKVGPPDYYLYQAQTQIYTLGLDWCLIVAKVGASDMRAYFIDADPFLHEEMEDAVRKFWKRVGR